MAQNRPTLAQRTRASVLQRTSHRPSGSDENAAPASALPSAPSGSTSAGAGAKASVLAGGAQRVPRAPLAPKQLGTTTGEGTSSAGGVVKAGRRALGDVSNKDKSVAPTVEGKPARPRSSTITALPTARLPLRPVSQPAPARSSARGTSISISKPAAPIPASDDVDDVSPALPPAPRLPQVPLPGAVDYAGPRSRSADLQVVRETGILPASSSDEFSEDQLEEEEEEEDMMEVDEEELVPAPPEIEIPTSKSEPMLPSVPSGIDILSRPGLDAFESTALSSSTSTGDAATVARQVSPSSLSDEEEEEDPAAHDWVALPSREHRKVLAELDRVRRAVEEEVDPLDTTMVAEYSEDIFEYMRDLECSVMPSPTYMSAQSEIEWSMRTTLVDWLLQVHLRYHMLPETLWIAINIVDRFLSARVVSLVKLQLVGVTAMFIAAKYEEILAPSVDEFVYMTENGYTKDEILKGERIVLQTLDFKISNYCSPYSWVRRISKADDYDIHTRTLSKFLMEVTLLDERFLRAKPSLVAAVGMYLARRMLGQDWDDLFVFYSSYTELQVLPGAQFIVERLRSEEFEQFYVCKKYATKRFLKASIFAREWAKKRGAAVLGDGGMGGRK